MYENNPFNLIFTSKNSKVDYQKSKKN